MPEKFAIECARSSSLRKESLCYGSGIIRFAESSIAFCEQSGLHCRSDSKRNPHLKPLPFAKGEASLLHTLSACVRTHCYPMTSLARRGFNGLAGFAKR